MAGLISICPVVRALKARVILARSPTPITDGLLIATLDYRFDELAESTGGYTKPSKQVEITRSCFLLLAIATRATDTSAEIDPAILHTVLLMTCDEQFMNAGN